MKNTHENNQHEAQRVLQAAYNAWVAGAELRKSRARNKDFTYGRQWNDLTLDLEGNPISEGRKIREMGKEPITNNMMRQMVKSIVGRFRSNNTGCNYASSSEIYTQNLLDELDSRALEEFLISGCCIQRIDHDSRLSCGTRVDNVNFNRFFINAIQDTRAWDCEIVGQLHDLSLAELITRTGARANRNRAAWIRNIYCNENTENAITDFSSRLGANNEWSTDFWHARNGKLRAIEVWTLESREILKCHDLKNAQYFIIPLSEHELIKQKNKVRRASNLPEITTQWDIEEVWRCRWFSPMGDVLADYLSPYWHNSHPFVMKFYPLTDGEVHSFVEDVIDQQKYVNRLITLIDHIMGASAKGVLLFPDTALPEGFTWNDIKRIWSATNGIIPYSPNHSGDMPKQISTNATDIGAYEMLQIQMKLFEDISGVNNALQGKLSSSTIGAETFQRQIDNATIALADIFDTFNAFRTERNKKLNG